jgi:hypothetical protein
MGNKKTKKNTKKKAKKTIKIIDVPLSKKESLGSDASSGNINYNYQKYYNTFAFLKEIIKKNKSLKTSVCIPDIGRHWMKGFLALNLQNKKNLTLKPVDSINSITKFVEKIKQCLKKRFVPINLQLIVKRNNTHANIILMDSKKKTIELFEPHGDRSRSSQLESISKGYYRATKAVKKFFNQYFSSYTFIPPSKYEPSEGLQDKIDAFSGMCVTWSILYIHYRLLNPDVSQKELVKYLNKTINKRILLQYTRYVEDIIKHKI